MARTFLDFFYFFVAASAVAYGCTLVGTGIVAADSAGAYRPVIVRDSVSANQHQLSGMVMVDASCDELTLHTVQLSDTSYELQFGTWREPSVDCDGAATPRPFRTQLFAPAAGVDFIATYNGKSLPIAVVTLTPSGRF